MLHRASVQREADVRLIEEALARGRVVVGADRHRGAERVDRAGEHVAVELVLLGPARAVAQHHAVVELVLDQRVEGIERGPGRAAGRVAEEGRGIGRHRHAAERGDAAVGDALVLEVLVAQRHQRLRARAPAQGRVDARALEPDAVAVALGVLVQAVETQRQLVVDRLVDVRRQAAVAVRAQRDRGAVRRRPLGLLAHAVDQPAGGATAEDHRVRALEHFHALDVVEVAVVLDVVADAVDEEVAGGADAAEDRRLAVALALREAHARHVARGLGNALHRAVAQLVAGHHADRLRRVAQRRVGLGGGGAAPGGVAPARRPWR